MQLPSHEIEIIVQVVLDRLRERGLVAATSDKSAPAFPACTSDGIRRISERVVTLQSLGGSLQDVRVVQVPSHAVVTPSVRDELRQRGIALRQDDANDSNTKAIPRSFVDSPTSQSSTASLVHTAKLYVVASESKWSVVRSVVGEGNLVRLDHRLNLSDKLQTLSVEKSRGNLLWCTDKPYATLATCYQNQLTAVGIWQASELQRAILECDPQAIVLDETSWSSFQVARVARSWLQLLNKDGAA